MRTMSILSYFCICLTLLSTDAFASCQQQSVYLSSGGKPLEHWDVKAAEVHLSTLPNGFQLGLQIEPATTEKYRELLNTNPESEVPELVKISLFDMSGAKPKLLTHTWGGANSIQGYGSSGGANRVVEFGAAGIHLFLLKPSCVKLKDLQ